MTAFTYLFRSARQPSAKELHCLWAALTNKKHMNKSDLPFKVRADGRMVQVTTDLDLPSGPLTLDTNAFEFLRKTPAVAREVAPGQFVTLVGELAYSVHSTKTNKDFCPVDAIGNLKPEHRKTFLAYLTRALGVDCEQAFEAGAISFAWEDRSVPEDKVWLNDVITVFVTAAVTDAAAVQRLAVSAVGRRKSYGLGAFQLAAAADMTE